MASVKAAPAHQVQQAVLDLTAEQWLRWVFLAMYERMHRIEEDNFDAVRYKGIPPNAFFADQHAGYLAFLVAHAGDFFRTRTLLVDETSRLLFDQLVLFRLLGHLHVRLPYNNDETKSYNDIADGWRVQETTDGGLLGNLAIFDVPQMNDRSIRVKCWRENIAATFLARPYYFNRDGYSVEPAQGEHVIDAGGCFGDTALAFAAAVGESGHVYTFDPLPKHCAIIRENLAMNPVLASRISVHEYGLSDLQRTGLGFAGQEGAINPGATAFNDAVSTDTLDRLVASGAAPRIDYIKMDVEGSELDALKGAETIIRRDRPRLAISLYHRTEDFISIPLWIDQMGCGYRFFLDHYSMHHEETVLYARA
jgi:FkbM family methyltransferase